MSLALTTFDGNCHCGAYRFRAVLPEIKSAVSCSCSLCRKTGALWAYLGEGSLAVTHGDDSTLSSYSSHALTIKVRGPFVLSSLSTHSIKDAYSAFANGDCSFAQYADLQYWDSTSPDH